jgi:hypothetical protein
MAEQPLAVSHDAFSGTASDFAKLRQIVALAMGGSYPPHQVYDERGQPILQAGTNTPLTRYELDQDEWVWGDGYTWESNPGLGLLFDLRSDGAILLPENCEAIADELEALLPAIEAAAPADLTPFPGRAGSYPEAVRRFIYGCRRAADTGETLVFG